MGRIEVQPQTLHSAAELHRQAAAARPETAGALAAAHASAVRAHRGAIQAARDATDTYADRLERARTEAHAAKRAEETALTRIATLKGKIADEEEIQRIAGGEVTSLSMQLAGD